MDGLIGWLFLTDEQDCDPNPESTLTTITDQQAEVLRRVYISDPAPSMTKCQYMSEETGLRINTIKTWFREKRCRDRKFFERDEKLAYGK